MLDAAKQLITDRWLDQPDAHEQIDRRRDAGTISDTEATRLHQFVDDGFTMMSIDIDDAFAAAFEADIDRLWARRPADVAVSSFSGNPTSMYDFDAPEREPGYRIPDLHGHSERALELYLHPEIFRMVELILGEEAIAFQSLYFEYGSAQGLHRDPMFVRTNPAGHMVASWVALEDIAPDSGPLAYVPGSHRLPWFEFTPGTIEAGSDRTKRLEFQRRLREQMQERGLEARAFTCRRGDVFLWHAGLVHGGQPVANRQLTRKSYVTHYSTAANYHSRRASMKVRDGDGWRSVSRSTDEVLRRPGSRGLASPMVGYVGEELAGKRAAAAPLPADAGRLTHRIGRSVRNRLRSRSPKKAL